jgi:hypothetical protein
VDGFIDIAVSCQGPAPLPSGVTIVLNDQAGAFSVHSIHKMGLTYTLVSGDLNDDSYFDVIATNPDLNRLTVLLNDTMWSAPEPIRRVPARNAIQPTDFRAAGVSRLANGFTSESSFSVCWEVILDWAQAGAGTNAVPLEAHKSLPDFVGSGKGLDFPVNFRMQRSEYGLCEEELVLRNMACCLVVSTGHIS